VSQVSDPPDDTDSENLSCRRYEIALFIVHPTIDPSEITSQLGLAPVRTHRMGDQRTTPKGTMLEGTYSDTRWRNSVRYQSDEQYFAEKIDRLLDHIAPHKAFLNHLSDTGGTLEIIVQFLDGQYYGDTISNATLSRIASLDLRLGIESFGTAQFD
jgi:hypothetical protein